MKRIAVLAVAALAAGGCGGDDPQDVLRETADKLPGIRSGTLAMRMTVEGTGSAAEGGAVGFELRGPFALPKRRGLPRARVDYTQLAGTRRATVTLTLADDAGFATVGGRSYRLPPDRVERLRTSAGGLGGDRLRIAGWVKDPKLSDGGRIGGAETDQVTARLDVAVAARDLLRISRALGPGGAAARALEGESARELESAVKRATFDLRTGKEDRLLRRLTIAIDLAGRDVPGAKVRFSVAISEPGKPVEVNAPADPLPASALPSG